MHWKKPENEGYFFIDVSDSAVVVGTNYGSESKKELKEQCSHDEFIDGKLHEFILKHFGKNVLKEVIKTVTQISEAEDF